MQVFISVAFVAGLLLMFYCDRLAMGFANHFGRSYWICRRQRFWMFNLGDG